MLNSFTSIKALAIPARYPIGICVILLMFLFSCSTDQPAPGPGNTPPTQPSRFSGSWSIGWPNLFHDGNPYVGENFIVFSEASSEESRIRVADFAELSFEDIMLIMDITKDDMDFLPGNRNKKIHILADYAQSNMWGLAYRDGTIMRALDSPNFNGDLDRWKRVLQHEITHVVEFLLIGNPAHQQANTVWLREGFANYGARNHQVNTTDQIEEWRSIMRNVPGKGNPISIRIWSDFPQAIRDSFRTTEYYKFFEVAVRYLIDEQNGNGTSMMDMKNFYEDLGDGMVVDEAFQKHFHMTLAHYEANIWEILTDYLED